MQSILRIKQRRSISLVVVIQLSEHHLISGGKRDASLHSA